MLKAKFNLPKRNLCANFNMPDCSMSASFEMSNGTKNYEKLENKPSINGVELIGDKTSADLGLATSAQGALAESALQEVPSYYVTETELASELLTKQNVINDLSEIREGASLGATSVQPADIAGVVKSVNGIEPVNGNVTIEVPQQVNADWNATSGVAKILNKPTIPTDTGDLTNNAGYIKGISGTDVTNALGYVPYNSSNPNNYITSSALNGYATENWVVQQDYLTGITGSQVTNALGYTPVNPSNLSDVATSGSYNDLENKPTIGSGTVTFTQGGVTKGTINMNQSGDTTIALEQGGGGVDLTAGTDLEIVSIGSQGLPNGYTLLEWVESSGLQSLSLGFSGNCTIEFTVQMAHIPTSNEVLLTSNPYANAGTWFGITSDNTWAYCDISGTTKIDVVMNATSQGLNGTINGNAFSRNIPITHGTWTLFNNIPASSSASTYPSFMKLFALKATQNGVVIRNLIPCKNNNNVAGLYDTINSVFYFSTSGTQLIAGTVIPTGKVINFTNESGYTKNQGTVTSVNGVQPDTNGNVTLVTGGVTDVEVNGNSVVADGVAEIDLTGYQEKLTAGTDLEIVEGSTLPAGYVQLKSITSTTTQYINTKISMTANYKAIIVGRLTQRPSSNFSTILGADNQNNNATTQGKYNVILGWGNASNGFYTENCIPSGATLDYTYSSYPWDTETHTFTVTVTPTQTTLNIDGVINTISLPPAAWNTPAPLYLFTRNLVANGGIGSITPFELEKIEQYQNGVLVFNGIPCKLGDIVGLYNTVTNEFLPNSGTGAFIEGDTIPNETIINFTNESGYIQLGTNANVSSLQIGNTSLSEAQLQALLGLI